MKKNYFAISFIWSVVAKLLDTGIKFFTIPLLLKYFGVNDYGVLTLAMSVNAYIQLMDMGMNTGSIKFLSQWIGEKKYRLVDRVARTNVTFYLIIGSINVFGLIILASFGRHMFNINASDYTVLRQLFYVLAFSSVFTWCNFAFSQLIIANQKIKFIQIVSSVRSVINLLLVFFTIYYNLSLVIYFILFVVISALMIIPNYILCRLDGLIKYNKLGFYWDDFRVVFKYSIGIFAMSFFQLTAHQSRPIILGIFSSSGASVLTEYKVVEVVPNFITAILGLLIGVVLPKVSQNIGKNDTKSNQLIAYLGTKYSSMLLCILAFPFLLSADEFLNVYVGDEFSYLSSWFILWISSLFIYLYNMPISALVLATGKTRMLVLSSALGCILSIGINVLFCEYYGVGSAILGYIVFVLVVMSFYYFYFIKKVLLLSPLIVFKNAIIPMIAALISFTCVKVINFGSTNNYFVLVLNALVFILFYFVIIMLFHLINVKNEHDKKNIKENYLLGYFT